MTSFSVSPFRGTFFVALSEMLFGLMGLFGTKVLQHGFSIEAMLCWRFTIAAVVILAMSFLLKLHIFRLNRVKPLILLKTFIFGAITYSGGSGFYFVACKYIDTGIAMVIFFSFPVFVTLLTVIFDRGRMSKFIYVALAALILGLLLLRNGNAGSAVNMQGISFAALAAFCFACYVYNSQHTTKVIDPHLLTLLVCTGNALIYLSIAIYRGSFQWPQTWAVSSDLLFLGVMVTALPIQLLLMGLRYISSVRASLLSALEPVTTVLMGYAFLNEVITFWQLVGVIVIISGAILVEFEGKSDYVKVAE